MQKLHKFHAPPPHIHPPVERMWITFDRNSVWPQFECSTNFFFILIANTNSSHDTHGGMCASEKVNAFAKNGFRGQQNTNVIGFIVIIMLWQQYARVNKITHPLWNCFSLSLWLLFSGVDFLTNTACYVSIWRRIST